MAVPAEQSDISSDDPGRQPAETKIGPKRIHTVRVRGGNTKHRGLRLDSGNYAWASEHATRKTRIIRVVYNASDNELVRTNTLVKGSIIEIDATPFRQWFEAHYGQPISQKKTVRAGQALGRSTTELTDDVIQAASKDAPAATETKQSAHVKRVLEERKKTAKIDPNLTTQFNSSRLLACISSRPGQSGRADGYILEGDELDVRDNVYDARCLRLTCIFAVLPPQDRIAQGQARRVGYRSLLLSLLLAVRPSSSTAARQGFISFCADLYSISSTNLDAASFVRSSFTAGNLT